MHIRQIFGNNTHISAPLNSEKKLIIIKEKIRNSTPLLSEVRLRRLPISRYVKSITAGFVSVEMTKSALVDNRIRHKFEEM